MKVPTNLITAGNASAFPAGSLVFRDSLEHKAAPLELGIKVGNGSQIFVLTQWWSGNVKSFDTVEPQGQALFGIPRTDLIGPQVEIDLSQPTVDTPDRFHGGDAGLISAGPYGLRLHSVMNRGQFEKQRSFEIDLVSWDESLLPGMANPGTWFKAWSLSYRLGPETTLHLI